MNLLDAVSQAQGGQGLANLASQFGISTEQAQGAVSALVPQLAAGMKNQSGGLGALVGMLSGGTHAEVSEQPATAFGEQGISMGKAVLGQVFGSHEVTQAVANNAAQQSGVPADILHQMMPVITTMVMGALAKQGLGAALGNGGANASAGGAGGLGGLIGGLMGGGQGAATGGSSATSMLSSILDANHDGNVADDLMKMAGSFFNRK